MSDERKVLSREDIDVKRDHIIQTANERLSEEEQIDPVHTLVEFHKGKKPPEHFGLPRPLVTDVAPAFGRSHKIIPKSDEEDGEPSRGDVSTVAIIGRRRDKRTQLDLRLRYPPTPDENPITVLRNHVNNHCWRVFNALIMISSNTALYINGNSCGRAWDSGRLEVRSLAEIAREIGTYPKGSHIPDKVTKKIRRALQTLTDLGIQISNPGKDEKVTISEMISWNRMEPLSKGSKKLPALRRDIKTGREAHDIVINPYIVKMRAMGFIQIPNKVLKCPPGVRSDVWDDVFKIYQRLGVLGRHKDFKVGLDYFIESSNVGDKTPQEIQARLDLLVEHGHLKSGTVCPPEPNGTRLLKFLLPAEIMEKYGVKAPKVSGAQTSAKALIGSLARAKSFANVAGTNPSLSVHKMVDSTSDRTSDRTCDRTSDKLAEAFNSASNDSDDRTPENPVYVAPVVTPPPVRPEGEHPPEFLLKAIEIKLTQKKRAKTLKNFDKVMDEYPQVHPADKAGTRALAARTWRR